MAIGIVLALRAAHSLTAFGIVLTAAIDVKNKKLAEEAKIQADATRMQEEAVEQTRKMMEELQNQNFTVQEASGLIADLTQLGLSKKITFGAKNKAILSAAQLALDR